MRSPGLDRVDAGRSAPSKPLFCSRIVAKEPVNPSGLMRLMLDDRRDSP
jgi:hypothetical protein